MDSFQIGLILEAKFRDCSLSKYCRFEQIKCKCTTWRKSETENINFVKCYPTWLNYGLRCHKYLSRNINNPYLNV